MRETPAKPVTISEWLKKLSFQFQYFWSSCPGILILLAGQRTIIAGYIVDTVFVPTKVIENFSVYFHEITWFITV